MYHFDAMVMWDHPVLCIPECLVASLTLASTWDSQRQGCLQVAADQGGSLWRQGGQRQPLIRSRSGSVAASSPSCLFADGRSTEAAFTAPCLAQMGVCSG